MVVSSLQSWFDRVGIKVAPGVEAVQTDTKGLALETSPYWRDENADIAEEDSEESVIAAVPAELILSCDRFAEMANEDWRLRRWMELSDEKETEVLHRGLIYLWLIKKDNVWKDYFDALPLDVDLPFSYNISRMQDLDLSAVSLHHAALIKRLSIEKSFERFMKTSIGRASRITLEQWLIPHIWISSRGLTHPLTKRLCLVPLIDLCNHATLNANVRYEVNTSGDFELRAHTGSIGARQELCLDYGIRSAGEFVFNYGFYPEDKNEKDFDEVFKVFDPSDDEISSLLCPKSPNASEKESKDGQQITYDMLLDFFEEDLPQVLRVTRLPESSEPDEAKRYRFHNNFIMAMASIDMLNLIQERNGNALYLGSERLSPNKAFEAVLALGDASIVQKGRELVAVLCEYFSTQMSGIKSNSPMIAKLATSEASIFKSYASFHA